MHRSDIPLIYATTEHDGQRIHCPWCKSTERSFSISRKDGGFAFHCHRDSCRAVNPSSGTIGAMCAPSDVKPSKGWEPRPLDAETRQLHPSEAAYLMRWYNLYPKSIDAALVRYAPELRRYIFPIRDPWGNLRGHIARDFGGERAKAINYTLEHPFIHWTARPSDTIVVVEDVWSALRVHQATDARAVALLGTWLTTEAQQEIAAQRAEEIIIALDEDATQKALEMQWATRLDWGARVVRLERDLKNESTDAGIREVLGLGIYGANL